MVIDLFMACGLDFQSFIKLIEWGHLGFRIVLGSMLGSGGRGILEGLARKVGCYVILHIRM